MLPEKIMSVSSSLAALAGQVSDEQWSMIRVALRELGDAMEIAARYEGGLGEVPASGDRRAYERSR